MALLTFTKRNYESEQDFERLIHYLYDPAKLACASSNLLYYQYPEILCTQWCYCHHYFYQSEKNWAFHYILSFDTDHENIKSTYPIVADDIVYTIYSNTNQLCPPKHKIQDCNVLCVVHRLPRFHFHILIDTVDSQTGKRLFIFESKLKKILGKTLLPYHYALCGYSFYADGKLNYGNVPPHFLYE